MATVSKSFTAVGQGNVIFVRGGESFTYDVSGTFVGKVKIGRSNDGGLSWVEVAGPFSAAAAGTLTNDVGPSAHYMFACTEFTSGTIVTALVNLAKRVRTFANDGGVEVLAINSDGVSVTGTAAVSGNTTVGGTLAVTGLISGTAGIKTKVATTNTANPPTQAELVTAFGAAATTGGGFVGVLNDNGGGTATYLIYSDGTNYFYVLGTVGA